MCGHRNSARVENQAHNTIQLPSLEMVTWTVSALVKAVNERSSSGRPRRMVQAAEPRNERTPEERANYHNVIVGLDLRVAKGGIRKVTMNQMHVKTRAELLATQLEGQIANGEFGPGEMVGTLDELKQRSGYARSTVAEAIRLLSDRGVAEIRPGRGGGVYVATDSDPVVRIGRTLLTISGQPSAVADAIAVRKALEPLIVMDATRHRDEADIRELRSILQELADAIPEGTTRFLPVNWRLHLRISEITPNVFARSLYRGMLQYTSDQSSSAEHSEPSNDRPWLEMRYQIHRELVEAIASGDTHRANQAVSSHQHSQLHSESYL